ncbi:MAG TPA: TPM domain-containing protein [Candidatus Paceibacterota bacterium]
MKIRFITTVTLLVITLLGYSQVIPPKPNPQRLVNDYIGLLSAETRESLEQQLINYDNRTSIQIAVVIVEDAIADGSDEAIAIGKQWGVGQRGLNNGIVFFIARTSRSMFIATGAGIEADLTDVICNHICQDVVVPYFKVGEYDKGVQSGIDEIQKTLTSISWDERERFKQEQARQRKIERERLTEKIFSGIVALLIFASIIALPIVIIRRFRRITKRRKELQTYYNNIVADEVVEDPLWPNWAKNDSESLFTEYWEAKEDSIEALNSLPGFFVLRFFISEKDLERVQAQLEQYDKVDRALAKIRDDVKLYDTAAEQAIKDTKELAKKVEGLLLSPEVQKHNFNAERAALVLIQSEIAKELVITDHDSKRTCFLKAYVIAERITQLQKTIQSEIDAEKQYVEEMNEFLKKQQFFTRQVAQYMEVMDSLGKYPSTVMAGLDTLIIFENKIARANELIGNVQLKVLGNSRGVYTDAALRAATIKELIDSLGHMYDAAVARVNELLSKQSKYVTRLSEVQGVVTEAQKEVKDSDVGTTARNLARDAQNYLTEAERLAAESRVDWILVHKNLEEADKNAEQAIKKAKSDKSSASSARSSNRSYYSTNSTPMGGSLSGGSSFGGFGGGNFGGGGGGGKW